MDARPRLLVIGGPTASGKTACAACAARLLDGEVISADSMQIYRGMEVLTAMPTEAEMRGVPHHMLGVADPAERCTAAAYGQAARRIIDRLIEQGRTPVVCGGTGLYVEAIVRPMRFSVEADPALHEALMAQTGTREGRARLHAELSRFDPEAAARLHANDARRVVRAIEVYRLTGVTQTEHNRADAAKPDLYDARIFALDWPRDVLYSRIDARVDRMLAEGLEDEVRRLLNDGAAHPTAAQAIGFKEIAAYLRGETSREEAVRRVKQASRNLAKRQITWFTNRAGVTWIQAQHRTPEHIAEEIVKRYAAE